jgi:hypothetical protein
MRGQDAFLLPLARQVAVGGCLVDIGYVQTDSSIGWMLAFSYRLFQIHSCVGFRMFLKVPILTATTDSLTVNTSAEDNESKKIRWKSWRLQTQAPLPHFI